MCKFKFYFAFANFVFIICKTDATIGCFKCFSVDYDNRACDDEFHNNVTTDIYQSPCVGGRKGRDGTFPGTSCIKITGKFIHNGSQLTVRGCALDSGTLTTETEIVRMSHCGSFEYQEKFEVRGCVQSCNDADGCNAAQFPLKFNLTLILALILKSIYNHF